MVHCVCVYILFDAECEVHAGVCLSSMGIVDRCAVANHESWVRSWSSSVDYERERWWSSPSMILTNHGHWLSSIPWGHDRGSSSSSSILHDIIVIESVVKDGDRPFCSGLWRHGNGIYGSLFNKNNQLSCELIPHGFRIIYYTKGNRD